MNIYVPFEVSPSEVLVIYITKKKVSKKYFAKWRMKTGEKSQLGRGLNKLNHNFMLKLFCKMRLHISTYFS